MSYILFLFFFFFQAEDGIRDYKVTGVQTCALPISGNLESRAYSSLTRPRAALLYTPPPMLAPWVPAIGRHHRLVAGAGLLMLFGLAAVAGGAGRAQGPHRFDPLAPTAPLSAMVVAGAARGGRRENRLAREKSPYLLQHAYNPVDWYPWGEEAFEKSRAENKPIFLSVGYSTCHWC